METGGVGMRKILRGIINNKIYTLEELGLKNYKIKKVYTILDEENMYAKFDGETGKPLNKSLDNLVLQHWQTVFYEDYIHDWNTFGNNFKLGAHSSVPGDIVDLLIEYE